VEVRGGEEGRKGRSTVEGIGERNRYKGEEDGEECGLGRKGEFGISRKLEEKGK
jgi:hypothetical protein